MVGSNLAWCHPVIYQRLVEAKAERPRLRVVVVDPRRTTTTDIADLHLAIATDGDTALFVGLLAELERRRAIDVEFVDEHTGGLAAALQAVSGWTLARVAEATGLSENDLANFYGWFAETEKVVTVFSQGVNQSATGTDKVNAIINCHLATGRIGRPGMGPFSITGQPNAMGGREVGGLANTLAAHMDFAPAAVNRVGRFWQSHRVATAPGLKAVDMFRAVADGRIKAIWIMATNPVDSMPEADAVRAALRGCPFVVVSDMNQNTDTVAEAHVRLPALGWGEKDGTVTNSERRISRQRPFLPAPAEARPDWWIVSQVACRMGYAPAFSYLRPAEIFAEHAALSAFENDGTRDFDLGGLLRSDYDEMRPTQWPVSSDGTARMFADGRFFTPDRRAHFVAVEPPAPVHPAAGMFVLNTGRARDHWHTMTRTGKAARLSAHIAEPFAEIHPDDAARLGIHGARLVRLVSQHGSAVVRALVTNRQRPSAIFAPMHWTDQFASSGRIDALVSGNTDPHSGQPALKMSEVAVRPADMAFYGFAASRDRPDLGDADYWATARATAGYRTELAWSEAHDWEDWICTTFSCPTDVEVLSFHDARTGRHNFALFDAAGLSFAVFIAPDPVLVSRQWVVDLLSDPRGNSGTRFEVLAGRPGAGRADAGATICACFSVGINTIFRAATHDGCHTVEDIGAATNAGTNCGSCRAEIRRIIESAQSVSTAKDMATAS